MFTLKPSLKSILLTLLVFLLLSLFLPLIPVLESVYCKDDSQCFPIASFFTLIDAFQYSYILVAVRWLPLVLELAVCYVLVTIVLLFRKH